VSARAESFFCGPDQTDVRTPTRKGAKELSEITDVMSKPDVNGQIHVAVLRRLEPWG
jgi:hypothetical protein